MAAQPSPQHPRYTAVWVAPENGLSNDVAIYSGDDENAAIAAAVEYAAPAAGEIVIRHYTPAGTLIGVRTVDRDEDGAQIVSSFGDGQVTTTGDAIIEPRRENVETDDPTPVEQPDQQPAPAPGEDERGREDEAATTAELDAAADELEQTIEHAHQAQGGAHERGELFDAADYTREDLALPQVDGHGIDKIRVAFTGSIMLDRSNPDHVALFKKLSLGSDVELRVAGEVTKTGTGWTTNKDGDLDAIVSERNVKVSTVYVLAAEEL